MSPSALTLLFSFLAVILAVYAAVKARSADEFGANAHKRSNDTWNKLSTVKCEFDRLYDRVISAELATEKAHHRLNRHERELFRDGEYPDQGLRDWARKWRGDLRQSVYEINEQLVDLRDAIRQVNDNQKEDAQSFAERVQFLEEGDERIIKERKKIEREAKKAMREAEKLASSGA